MKQLVICIDLEQDDVRSSAEAMFNWHGAHRALDWGRARPWHGGAVINWFVRTDVQTRTVLGDASWPLRHLYSSLRQALDNGDTVGAHPHLYRQVPGGWRNDFADPAFAWICAEAALEAHMAVFGEPSRTWRWGDRAGQPSLNALLASAGVLVDCTAEPGRAALPSRDGGVGLPPSYTGHGTEPRVIDGVIDWPLSTSVLANATSPASGVRAQHPVGTFDEITNSWLHGWCCDSADGRGDVVVDVELLINDAVVALTAADWYRPDLDAGGYGGGRHGARIGMRDEWQSLPSSAFTLRAAGHRSGISQTATDNRTLRGAEATVIPLPLETESEQFARMLAVLLRGGTSHVTLAMRSDVFLDPGKAAELERNCDTLAAHIQAGTLSTPQSLVSLAAPLLHA